MTHCLLQFQSLTVIVLSREQWLDDMDKVTRISGHDLRTELIKKSTGVVRNVIMMAHPDTSDDNLINMLREDFSDAPTMNKAREELLHMHQKPEEQMRVYVYRYGHMHQRSSGIRAADETHQHIIQDFINPFDTYRIPSYLTVQFFFKELLQLMYLMFALYLAF